MWLKYGFLLVVLVIATATAYPRKVIRRPCSAPRVPACVSTLATPYPAVIEVIEPIDCSCGCQKLRCNDQLILPPLAPELPCGLGYLPGALPLIADYFEPGFEYLTTGAYIPVSRCCDSLTLAAPVCPNLAPLVRPIIL